MGRGAAPAWLAREHPHLVPLYAQLHRRGASLPQGYRDALDARVAPLLERHRLARPGGEGRRGVHGGAGAEGFAAGSTPVVPQHVPAGRRADRPDTLF